MPLKQNEKKPLPLIKFTNEFYDMLDEMKSPIARAIMMIESAPLVHNGLKIELVDISKQNFHFDVMIGDKVYAMKVGKFIRYYFQETFDRKSIFEFQKEYNSVKSGGQFIEEQDDERFKVINSEDYNKKFDPKDIKSTFISLVTETYPYGHEEEVVKFLPTDLTKDEFGNYYKIIGKSETMFTSHLDTADRSKSNTILYESSEGSDVTIVTDGSTILGADDKSGVTIMLYMMAHNIPGVYYFFIGEERGGIGSGKVANVFDSVKHLEKIKRCISFDRRNYHSVITSQMGRECCSDEFGNALSKELNSNGMDMSLDPTGIYTDSANFMDDIPECTNISVGYFNEHTDREYQNITFLEKLCKACVKINWENLPTVRKVGFGEYIKSKYRNLIADFRKLPFYGEIKLVGELDKAFIKIDFETRGVTIDEALDDLMSLSTLESKYKLNLGIHFSNEFIKIELK